MVTVDELAAQVAALQRRVAVSESVLAIQDLKARYGALVDQRFSGGAVVGAEVLGDVALRIAALFTDDGVWDGGPGLGVATGRPSIAARLREPTLVFSRHFFVNPRIEVDVDGDSATGRWDLLSPCRRADGTSYWMCGFEDDRYALVDGIWLHRSMTLTTVFMAPVGEGWTRLFV
jgi:hypothetical protein